MCNEYQHFINAGMDIARDNNIRAIGKKVKSYSEHYWRIEQSNAACDILSPDLTKNALNVLKGFRFALEALDCELKVCTQPAYNEAGESALRIYEVDVYDSLNNCIITALRCYSDDYLTM